MGKETEVMKQDAKEGRGGGRRSHRWREEAMEEERFGSGGRKCQKQREEEEYEVDEGGVEGQKEEQRTEEEGLGEGRMRKGR